MASRVIKLVIIGPSGCGKTSLRGQYISGRFATGYRATIGTDFISKTIPISSSTNPTDSVTLQIWDTAGQERFSSLSAAFFRGADAVMLVFDVNQPQSLVDLKRWWGEFKDKAPVRDGEEENFCVVVVGNKMDLLETSKRAGKSVIERFEASRFLDELIPPSHSPSPPPSPPKTPVTERVLDLASLSSPSLAHPLQVDGLPNTALSLTLTNDTATPHAPPPVISNLNSPPPDRHLGFTIPPHLRSQVPTSSKTKYGTMTTVNTSGFSVYHTPPSSLHRYPSRANDAADHSPTPPAEVSTQKTIDLTSDGFLDRFRNFKLEYRTSDKADSRPTPMHLDDADGTDTTDDLDFDFDYATAASSPVPSATTSRQSSLGPSAARRSRIRGFDSSSSLSTIKPRDKEAPPSVLQTMNLGEGFGASITHGILPVDPLTPSASPPSPPKLTASLMATLDQPQPQSSSGLDIGPKLFFASAKTGGKPVSDPFEYVANRVVARLEWEERITAMEEEREANEATEAFADSRYRRGLSGFRLTDTLKTHWKDTFGGSASGPCCQI